ncbi:EAL domain-containing protein [Rhodanobacter sp. C01]|uniref:bifunctional diguanylate cyclase/phosphodiesterase n=1 Tax=Rhodanobacter sp. C01 TaxID=1945856 RepID=UPI00098567C6|nr:EAL domain-containing protein [Rhodanobacter sp. C01]OOG46995.1 bifunctional diguanylate cyclase/phosphodiesterase [Rhodanobacter sp. C01]
MHNRDQNSTQIGAEAAVASSESFYAALSEIGQLLVRSLDPPVLYEAVVEVLERRIGARFAMVGELDRESRRFRRIAPARVAPGTEDIYPESMSFTVARPAFWQGAPQVETDIRHVQDLEMLRPAYVRHGIAAAAAVPVLKFGEVCAALAIRSSRASFFSPQMIDLLQQVAASIGLGLEAHGQRMRLLQSAQDEARQRYALRLLGEMIKLATHSVDEPALLAEACRAARRIGGYRAAWIGLLQEGSRTIVHLCAQDGLDASIGTDTKLDLDDAGRVHDAAVIAMATGQARISRRLSSGRVDWPFVAGMTRLHAVLALPLRVDGAIIGVFVIAAAGADAFSTIEVEVFSEMTVELGLGIQMQRAHAARVAAEQNLRLTLQHFRTILSTQYTGILVVSEDNRVKFANEAFCTLFGLSETPAELEGQPAASMYGRLKSAYEDPEREWARIQQILARGEPVEGEEVSMQGNRIFLRDFVPIRVDGVAQGRLWQQRDITEQKMHEARVERLAFYDVVTGLPNRRLLFEMLEQARARASSQNSQLAVGVLDLDRFKSVNDTIGHAGGDRVLAEAAARILGMLREADVLARFGGDEFALVISGLDSREQLDVISRCILQALRAPFNLMSEQLYLSASVGWTLFPLDQSDAEGLVRHADLAMYAAKEAGKDRGALYEPVMEMEQLRLQAMRERIAQALQQSHLQLMFQPIVFIDGLPGLHGVAGMEALLRLNDTGQELIEPASFMHVLDDPQLARPIGRYVLDEALRRCQAWMHEGMSIPVSVNISTRHLLHPAFFSDIDAVLDTYPDVMDVGFGIEVTETGPSMDHAHAKAVIEECRRRGIRVGLDDFGTGSASLSHIQQLDIEHIKLDQSFVRDILSDERNMAIAAGVITTARMLAKTVIAEGVETAEQGDLLASLGCHQLQGFSISRPLAAEAVPAWVTGWVPPASWARLVSERQSLLTGQSDSA